MDSFNLLNPDPNDSQPEIPNFFHKLNPFPVNFITGDTSPSKYEIQFHMNSINGDTRILLIIKSIPIEFCNWRHESPSKYDI